MSHLNPYSLAILLVALGVGFWLILRLLLHMAPRIRPTSLAAPQVAAGEDLTTHEDAVLLVQPGGHVSYINERGRQIFHLMGDESPNLERLAQRARPGEQFLKICAGEGAASLVLDGRLLEGRSHQLQTAAGPLVAVTLSFPEITAGLNEGAEGVSTHTLQTVMEVTQAMTANLELEPTLNAIIEHVSRLVPADFWEITLWDEQSETFTPYHSIETGDQSRRVEKVAQHYHKDEGYSGWLGRERRPLLIVAEGERKDVHPAVDQSQMPIRAYMGVPLLVDDQLIGTLELGSPHEAAFDESDLTLLKMLAGPAAVALRNALRYQQEQRRSAEVSGLGQLAQAFGASRDPRSMFSRMVQAILPLVKVQILGFLLFNEATRTLEGQEPFHGLPPQFVNLYRVSVLPNSAAEQTLLDQDVLMSENAAEDAQWEALGLDHLAQAASLRDTVLVPLTSGGRMLGYLQASNHVDGSAAFTQDELHLLMIVASQAAPIIENATLVQQTRLRAQRNEALRRVASLASSSATLDEILTFSLRELAQLLQADLGAVFLLDPDRTRLRLHEASIFGQHELPADAQRTITVEDAQYPFTITGSQHVLNSGRLPEERTLMPFYRPFISSWKILSAVVVPLVVRDEGVGELWLGSQTNEFFDQGDLQVVSTAAGQLAGVVEQAYLFSQTDESLRRRVEQLTALTRISRELSTSLDLSNLLQLVYDEALRTTHASCGTIRLFDLNQTGADDVRVRFFVGDTPQSTLTEQERQALESGETLNVAGQDLSAPHAGVASLLIAPIRYRNRPAGLITLHAGEAGHFDNTAVEITQSLAAQAAVALGNALQFEEQNQHSALLKRELETLGRLFDVSRAMRANLPLDQALGAIAAAIREATPFQVVLISLVDGAEDQLQRVAQVGLGDEVWADLKAHSQSWQSLSAFFQEPFRYGSVYFIPADQKPVIPEEVHAVQVLPSGEQHDAITWNGADMLLVPLTAASGEPLGLISLDAPADGRRPDKPTFDALELFAQQASVMIESQRTVSTLETRLSTLEESEARLNQQVETVNTSLPLMLHKDLQQTLTIQSLGQQIERVRGGLAVAETALSQPDIPAMLREVSRELLERMHLQIALIAEQEPGNTRLTEVIGSVPAGVTPEALFGQRNPLRQSLQDGKMLLAASLDATPEWQNNALLKALGANSFICMPFELGANHSVGLLAVGNRTMPSFPAEDQQVFAQVSRQIGVGLQNLQLLVQTRQRLHELDLLLEFTRKLGSLDPASITQSLVDAVLKVIVEGQAGWVAVWDAHEQALVTQAALGYPDNTSLLAIQYSPAERGDNGVALPLQVYWDGTARRVAEINFARDFSLSPEDLMNYRQGTGGRLPVSSLLVPLRRGENVLGVLVVDNFNQPEAFTAEDETLTNSLAQQAALALETAHLFGAAEQRAAQLQALTSVAGTITSSLRSDELVATLLDQLKNVLPYETATLWLRRENQLTVAAARGFDDNASRLGLAVELKDSRLFAEMLQTGRALLVNDVRSDERFPALVEPDCFSWLGIPLLAKGELIGAIALEKSEADFYTAEHIGAATTFASQAGVALENARLFEESTARAAELDQRSARLALLNQLSSELGGTLEIDHILSVTTRQLMAALNADRVAAVMLDDATGAVLQLETPAVEGGSLRRLPDAPLFERLRETRGVFSCGDVNSEAELLPLCESYFTARQTRSLLSVPLSSGAMLHGWLWVQSMQTSRFGVAEMELARTIGNQAAIAISNARLFAETRRLTEDLEKRVEERTAELRHEHQNTQTLLQIITELSASLDMSMVLNRTLNVLNASVGAEQSMIILAQSPQSYQAGQALTADGKAGVMEKDLSKWVVRQRAPALVDDITADARWTLPAGWNSLYRSAIVVPLIFGEEALGSLMLFSQQTGYFLLEQVGLVEAAARQIAVALNNAELFNLIRDQSEHVGAMLRDQQIEASRSRAILESVADGVLVTDAGNRITLLNSSAERVLQVKGAEMSGQALDQFTGLFGKEARTWTQTIQKWSQDARSYHAGESYAEQIELENGRIIAVNLAPVIWRDQFLGTVSIFRDITQEVQVDRMKSEFITNVSHELRTPMTSIKGYVEIMLMGAGGPLTDQQKHFLDVVKTNTERLSVLVNDLLDVSRIESGRVTLSFQQINLREIAEEVRADVLRRSKEENKPMEIELEIADDLPELMGDRERIQQVMMHLVNNGYNYTPAGGRVVVEARRDQNEVQVDVRDNGIGILPKDQKRIFDRFYRGNDPLVLATAGTGLGLALSKTLVEMHRGRMWFGSTGVSGEGSTFSFTLPIEQHEEHE